MPSFQEFYFSSSNGHSRIRAMKCLPDVQPKAILQIAHGIAEHIDRYAPFMEFLASNAYIVVANDHLGHGKSVSAPEDQLGFFADHDGWDCVVKDMKTLQDMTREEHPGLPYVMFGHSMGSFLTRTFLIRYPDKYDAAILSGTGHQAKSIVYSGNALAAMYTKFSGPRSNGKTLNDIAFGSYNKAFEPKRTEFDWLSRDNEQVDKYINDPLCGFIPTVSLFRDMTGGIKFITKQKNIDSMSKEQPVYFMSGDADPVGENGKGVNRAYKAFCKAGLHDVTIHLYPGGRHELLNETNKDQVFADVLAWLEAKVPTK